MLQPKPEIVNMTIFHDCRTFALFGITDSLLRPLDPIRAQISQSWEKVIFDLVTSDFDLGDLRLTFETLDAIAARISQNREKVIF